MSKIKLKEPEGMTLREGLQQITFPFFFCLATTIAAPTVYSGYRDSQEEEYSARAERVEEHITNGKLSDARELLQVYTKDDLISDSHILSLEFLLEQAELPTSLRRAVANKQYLQAQEVLGTIGDKLEEPIIQAYEERIDDISPQKLFDQIFQERLVEDRLELCQQYLREHKDGEHRAQVLDVYLSHYIRNVQIAISEKQPINMITSSTGQLVVQLERYSGEHADFSDERVPIATSEEIKEYLSLAKFANDNHELYDSGMVQLTSPQRYREGMLAPGTVGKVVKLDPVEIGFPTENGETVRVRYGGWMKPVREATQVEKELFLNSFNRATELLQTYTP